MIKRAKSSEYELYSDDRIRTYLKVQRGAKPWNVNYFACVDHTVVSPCLLEWQRFFTNTNSSEIPSLISIHIYSEELSDLNYSEDDSDREKADKIALTMTSDLLKDIKSEGDLFNLLTDVNNESIHVGVFAKIIANMVINRVLYNMSIEDSLEEAESFFGKRLKEREFFFKGRKGYKILNELS